MRSVEQGANPQVPAGQAIPNFPRTPDHISQMNGTLPFQYIPPFFPSAAELINAVCSAPMSPPPHIPGLASSSRST